MAKRGSSTMRHQRRLAAARMAHDADLLAVDVGIRLEIIQHPAIGPGPGAQHAPIIQLARLALVDQADDAFGRGRRHCRPAPSLASRPTKPQPCSSSSLVESGASVCDPSMMHISLPGSRIGSGPLSEARADRAAADDDRHLFAFGRGRRDHIGLDLDRDRRIGGIVHVPVCA